MPREVRVNGGEYVRYVQQLNKESPSLRSTDRRFVSASGAPYSVADASGEIIFEFRAIRLQDEYKWQYSNHLHLSGLSIIPYDGPEAGSDPLVQDNGALFWAAAAGGGGTLFKTHVCSPMEPVRRLNA